MTAADTVEEILREARAAFGRRDWLAARERFQAARAAGPIPAADVFSLGDCIWWLGEFRAAQAFYEESYDVYLGEDNPRQAGLSAFAVAGSAFMRGEMAYGSGWLGRAMRVLENVTPGVEQGYLLLMETMGAIAGGDLAAAAEKARAMQEAGRRYGDPNILALGTLSEGQVRIKQGQVAQGMRLLDEAMVAAVSDRLAPEWAGNIYCQMMVTCHELGDLERMREWTEKTARWCEGLQSPGPFMGICRVHRAQVFQVQGAWDRAEAESARVWGFLADIDLASAAEGRYQYAEIRRLRGDFAGAEEAYLGAHSVGRDPQPGLALLRLAQGRAEEGLIAVQTALASAPGDRLGRAWLCAAQAELALALGRTSVARGACDELKSTAADYGTSQLEATALGWDGAVLLREGHAVAALAALRAAALRWQQLSVPHEVARSRVWLALAYEAAGDPGAAALELEAAAATFTNLGAASDLRRVDELRHGGAPSRGHGLTARETEVLAQVSAGASNRAIANTLYISEKTVARHLSNIYAKLGVGSRTEAMRFAFENGLMGKTS